MFNPSKPGYLDPLQSEPVRSNFRAIAQHHAGPTPPSNPETGWTWLDTSVATNYRLRMFLFGTWVIILNNLTGGFPSQGGASKIVHTQAVADVSWIVTHNLNTEDVSVTIWDAADQLILPNSVTTVSVNQVLVTFLVAQVGRAIVIG
jgi:hypothetical protein